MRLEPHRNFALAAAAVLAALALTAPPAPAATAEQFLGPQSSENVCELGRDTHDTRPAHACEEQVVAARGVGAPSTTEVATVSPAPEDPADPGFSWSAAAIGAGTAGLLILASVFVLAVTGRVRVRTAR